MVAFKKILCPTDFSEPAAEALDMAKQLGTRFESELVLMHVVDPWPGVTVSPHVGSAATAIDPAGLQQAQEETARKALDDLLKAHDGSDLRIRGVLNGGRPADRIVEYAEEEDVDLIVIASHGLSGWRRFIFGSVAERVIRSTPRPVLTINGGDD